MRNSDTLRKPTIFARRTMGLEGREIAAEPVPVLRPGVRVSGSVSRCGTGSSLTGSTNIGSKRKASHRISIHEAQFDTMKSPAPGRHGSRDSPDLPRFRETSSTGIHNTPRTNSDNLDRIAVNRYEIALCIGGIGRRTAHTPETNTT